VLFRFSAAQVDPYVWDDAQRCALIDPIDASQIAARKTGQQGRLSLDYLSFLN
jgi:hypothetical protein